MPEHEDGAGGRRPPRWRSSARRSAWPSGTPACSPARGSSAACSGRAEAARIWDRHLLNCAALAELVPSPCSLIDLGSGAGLPGLVLAMLLPDVTVTLLEPMARRVTFLQECIEILGLANAEMRRGRAEDVAGQLAADVVTARAVAPMDRLAGLAIGLLKPGGLVLAVKGAGAAEEVSRARPELRRLGARDVEVLQLGGSSVNPAATVVRFTAGARPGRAVRSGSARFRRCRRR